VKQNHPILDECIVDLKYRGVKDILISSVDGLSGFELAIKPAFPKRDT